MAGNTNVMGIIMFLIVSRAYNFVKCQYIIEGPKDTVELRSRTIILTCYAEFLPGASVYWSMIGENSKVIYFYEGNGGMILIHPPPWLDWKYDVRKDDERRGIFDLYVNAVEWTDGGTYECRIMDSNNAIDDGAIADVVIIEQPLITQTPLRPVEGEFVNIWCSMAFGTPFINLTEEGDKMFPKLAVYYQGNQLLDGEYTEIVNPPNVAFSTVDEKHNMTLGWEDDGQIVQCVVTVDEPYRTATSWRPLDVLFGVRDMSFEPSQDQFFVGDTITCKVFANPEPDIVWKPLHDTSLDDVDGSQLKLDSSYIGNNKWVCSANNTVEGEPFLVTAEIEFQVFMTTTTITTTAVMVTDDEGGGTGTVITPSSLTIFCALLVLLKYHSSQFSLMIKTL